MKLGQPDLFTKRIRRAPEPSEFELHCTIADMIRVNLSPGWVWFHVPNGDERPASFSRTGKRRSAEGGRLKRMGERAGVSDLVFVSPVGARFHAMEIKKRGEVASAEQKQFLADIHKAGGPVAVVDTYEAAQATLLSWGAIRKAL